jgi:hypothetical protein
MPVSFSRIVLLSVLFSLLLWIHHHHKPHYHHINCLGVFVIMCKHERLRGGLYAVLVTFSISSLGVFSTPAPCKWYEVCSDPLWHAELVSEVPLEVYSNLCLQAYRNTITRAPELSYFWDVDNVAKIGFFPPGFLSQITEYTYFFGRRLYLFVHHEGSDLGTAPPSATMYRNEQ